MSDNNENKFDKLDIKIDKIQDRLTSIDVTLAAQHESLKLHIKRTNLLEQKLRPVEDHVTVVHGVLKLLGLATVLLGIIQALMKLKNG